MPSTCKAYIVHDTTSDPVPGTIERRDPRPNDVSIEILYCGICHSELHTAHNDWNNAKFPFVGGHEIIGRATAVGPAVKKFQAGDIVGIGCLVDSCRTCKNCKLGKENWCVSRTQTYNSSGKNGEVTKGGYSQHILAREEFVLKIPSNLDLAASAPLLCAGITTYSPLRAHGAGPGKRVGVVGLGGLGSMAIKFASAMGSEVTLFSRSHAKAAGAKAQGASRVVASSDPNELEAVAGTFDLIIDTIPFEHDFEPYLKSLDIGGCLVVVGQIGPLKVLTSHLAGNKSITYSNIGGLPETQEMLDFCGENNITCDVELIEYSYIAEAWKRVHSGDVKYRFVLDAKSL
uniref:Alcohol dehydrogenase n=1 Tax=Starmerella bombicola TaxID=75736 RepID=A0A3G2C690_STABO|nr:alcohol dehydrogenase [Starmerella bombicola]